ncbi:unnamed protein product [Meloidogyne enterolobii]|uniref:Uncharacterized protein n=1 Tax=Meloidogyne enterolobii TaxID=390850 RepID=A0ACB0ZVX7_MELEN
MYLFSLAGATFLILLHIHKLKSLFSIQNFIIVFIYFRFFLPNKFRTTFIYFHFFFN